MNLRHALNIFCLAILLLHQPSARCEIAPQLVQILEKPQISDDDYDFITFQILDRPMPLLQSVRQQWQELPAAKNPRLKARLGWLLMRLMGDGESDHASEAEAPQVAQETLALIAQHHLPIDPNEVNFFLRYVGVHAQKTKFEDEAEELLNLAHGMALPYAKSFALSQIAFEFNERRLRKELLPGLLHELREITSYTKPTIRTSHVVALQRMGSLVTQIGESEEGALISSKLAAFCKTVRPRKICTKIAYERGRSLNQEPGIQFAPAAIEAFQEALQLAEELQARFMAAASNYGLTIAYLKLDKTQEAIQSANAAFATFDAMKIGDWAASTLRYLSEAQLKAGDTKRALATIQQALEICPKDSTQDIFDIHKQFAAVYKALGLYEKAYQSLELYRNLEQEYHRDSVAKQLLELRNNSELRVQEQKNKVLDQELKKVQYLRLVTLIFLLLALVIIVLLGFSFVKARLARTIQTRMTAILDNIDEGIVLIDGKLNIQSTHSRHLAQLLRDDEPFEDCNFITRIMSKFNIEADRLAVLEQVLRIALGESSVNWTLNEDNLPQELFLKDATSRCFALHWVPILNEQDHVASVLLTLRDITSQRKLEHDVALERDLAKDRTEVLTELQKVDLAASFQFVSGFMDFYEQLIQDHQAGDSVDILRRLHTSKGVSRTLGLRRLSSIIHNWESSFQAFQAGTLPWPEVCQRLQADQPLLESYVLLSNLGTTTSTHREQNLINLVSDLQNSIQDQARKAAIGPVRLLINDSWAEWNPTLIATLAEVLPHLIANALDHGFILPETKHKKSPLIEIEAKSFNGDLRLILRDNGAGLNLPKLNELAKKMNFKPAPHGSFADVIFQDGASTADRATATSGRGIGLAAVKAKIEALAGSILVQAPPFGGTEFIMDIPANAPSLQVQGL